MNFSLMSCVMVREPKTDLEKMFRLASDLGIAGVEMVTLHGYSAGDIRHMADDYGVRIVAHTFLADLDFALSSDRKEELEKAKRAIDNALILGTSTVMIPTIPKDGKRPRDSRRNWIEGLKELMPHAEAVGVNLSVENFPGNDSPFVTAADFLEAAREIPELRLTFDNGNAASGEDPADSFCKTCSKVIHCHFKDWTISEKQAPGYKLMRDGRWYKPALIGEGEVDHKSCLEAMKKHNYNGCITIEYEGTVYSPEDAVRKALDYLDGLTDN